MKVHTTNYRDTFIEIAEDCPAVAGEAPPERNGQPSVARLQFDLLRDHPYKYTSDELLFLVYATRHDLTEEELAQARVDFFSKGQPCLRASPLAKRYGWGVHSDAQERVAIYGCETAAYRSFLQNKDIKVVRAMRSGR